MAMKILVACERSQTITIEARKQGHIAYSCDIEDCYGGHPEWHIKGDALDYINYDWDLLIAHPPCTYLTSAGARHLYKGGELQIDRYRRGLNAAQFFMILYNSKAPKICIENPVPFKIFGLPKYTQIINPYEHGHREMKRTCLWLKNLPLLRPTNIIPKDKRVSAQNSLFYTYSFGGDRQTKRSKTFSGIAKAMISQWCD